MRPATSAPTRGRRRSGTLPRRRWRRARRATPTTAGRRARRSRGRRSGCQCLAVGSSSQPLTPEVRRRTGRCPGRRRACRAGSPPSTRPSRSARRCTAVRRCCSEHGLLWWPLPHWNCHSWSPLSASSALNSPVGSPPNTRPPPVVSSDAHIGMSLRQRQRSSPVRGSKALIEPAMSSRSTATPAPQYGMLSLNSLRRRVAVAPTSCTGAVEELGVRVVASVRPLLGAGRAGPEVHRVALLVGEDLRRHVALLVDLAPVDAVDERRHPDRVHVRAVEDVEEPVLVEVGRELLPVEVEQDVLHRGVVVPHVVRRVLEVRLDLAGVGVHGDAGVGVEVVALADGSVEVGARVAGPHVDEVQLRVEGAGDPAVAAASLPGLAVVGPRLGPGLAGLRAPCRSATRARRSRGRTPRGGRGSRTPRRSCRR